jgi:hypothetical protein
MKIKDHFQNYFLLFFLALIFIIAIYNSFKTSYINYQVIEHKINGVVESGNGVNSYHYVLLKNKKHYRIAVKEIIYKDPEFENTGLFEVGDSIIKREKSDTLTVKRGNSTVMLKLRLFSW